MPPIEVWQNDGVPIKSWALDLEEGARKQMENMAALPFAFHHCALMPDAHQGYGMPVGGAFAATKAVVPYAIGVDIGCGVTLIDIGITADMIETHDVKALMDQVRRDVPVGNGPQGGHDQPMDVGPGLEVMNDAQRHRIGKAELDARKQIGTLGGGNHFLELQEAVSGDDSGHLFFMIHSGSRSLGKKTCDYHVGIAQGLNELWHSRVPDKEVAFLPTDDQSGQDYMTDMTFCLRWAEWSRAMMASAVISAISDVWEVSSAEQTLDVHHNFAAWENHYGKNVIVHRKGAVRAREGETVLIPGSMSTGSYIAEGLGNPETFDTCQHGAGRARSRAATRKMVSAEDLKRLMDDAGVYLSTPGDVRDESQLAYKDIEEVMRLSKDLIRPLTRLRPLGVVKG